MHGRVLSLQTVVLIGTVPVGGPFLGWLADTLDGRAPLVAGGVVSLLAAVFGWRASRRSAGDEVDLDDGQGRGGLVAVTDREGEGEGPRTLRWRRPEAELVDPE